MEEGRKITLANAYQARSVETSASVRMLTDPGIAALIGKYRNTDAESFTEEEKIRIDSLLLADVYRLDASFFAYQQGLLPEYRSTLEGSIRIYGPLWSDTGVHIPRESFRAKVDRVMAIVDKETAAAAETA